MKSNFFCFQMFWLTMVVWRWLVMLLLLLAKWWAPTVERFFALSLLLRYKLLDTHNIYCSTHPQCLIENVYLFVSCFFLLFLGEMIQKQIFVVNYSTVLPNTLIDIVCLSWVIGYIYGVKVVFFFVFFYVSTISTKWKSVMFRKFCMQSMCSLHAWQLCSYATVAVNVEWETQG